MFADFKDSTLLTEGMEPVRLIEHLNSNFALIDEIGEANRVLTLRTVGDGSLCVAGIPETNRTHPLTCASWRCNYSIPSERKIDSAS